jgi:hypothetical protein
MNKDSTEQEAFELGDLGIRKKSLKSVIQTPGGEKPCQLQVSACDRARDAVCLPFPIHRVRLREKMLTCRPIDNMVPDKRRKHMYLLDAGIHFWVHVS